MRELLDKVKNWVVYDADKEFYAKLFPESVPRKELFRLRWMSHADLPQVLAIEKQNYPFPWGQDIFEDCLRVGYSCWVCTEYERILGYCLMSVAVGEAHILNISVAPTERKQGIGRKMLYHLLHIAKGKAETVFLEVRPSNTAALALYQDVGFNQIGLRKNYYPAENGREDAIMLALHLF